MGRFPNPFKRRKLHSVQVRFAAGSMSCANCGAEWRPVFTISREPGGEPIGWCSACTCVHDEHTIIMPKWCAYVGASGRRCRVPVVNGYRRCYVHMKERP